MRAFRIAYDGTPYYGFQRQPDVPTVEDALFDALRALGVLEADEHKPAGYAAAGRTDAGVSAFAQTIGVEAPDWLTPRAFNAELPADVRAWASADAPAEFHATHHATSREYTYHLYAPTTSPETDESGVFDGDGLDSSSVSRVDDARFGRALEALSGTYDFHNLTADDENTVRSPTLEVDRDGPFLIVTVTASGFSRELVRRLVSLAHAVGTGESPLEKIDRVLHPEPLPGHEGIAPAPAEALVLSEVVYPDLEFEIDTEAASRTRAILERKRIEHLTGARISRQLRNGILNLECKER